MILNENKTVILKPKLSLFGISQKLAQNVSRFVDLPRITASLDKDGLNKLENLYYQKIVKVVGSDLPIILMENNHLMMHILGGLYNMPQSTVSDWIFLAYFHEDEDLINHYKTDKVDPIDVKVAELEQLLHFPFVKKQHIPIGHELTLNDVIASIQETGRDIVRIDGTRADNFR